MTQTTTLKWCYFLSGVLSAASLLLVPPVHAASIDPDTRTLLAQDSSATDESPAQLEEIRATTDGFFMRTAGAVPAIEMQRSRDRDLVIFDLINTELSPQFNPESLPTDQYGVSRWSVEPLEDEPSTLRIVMELADEGVDWQAVTSQFGGVVVIPSRGISRIPSALEDSPEAPSTPEVETATPATIQSIELSDSGILLIEADQSLTYESNWDRSSADYRIAIPNARLAEDVSTNPDLPSDSPLRRVQVSQEGDSVIVLVRPMAGVYVVGVTALSDRQLALQLEQNGRPISLSSPDEVDSSDIVLPTLTQEDILVVLDPGHGGVDPGAVGIDGLQEKQVIFPITLEVAELLEQQGAEVILTRTDDRTLDLEPRVQTANRAGADVFVSIHANAISLSRPDVNGVETYYTSAEGMRVAQFIQASLLEATQMNDRGVKQARFYVIVNTAMPAALVEVGFVTGEEDAALLADPEFRSTIARAIARGILEYIQATL